MTSDRQLSARTSFALVAILSAYALVTRVAPYALHEAFGMPLEMAYRAYPWNFSPLLPLAVFGGATLGLRAAFGFPLAVYFAGDLLIALLSGEQWGFYGVEQAMTYAAIAGVALCGIAVRRPLRRNAHGTGPTAVLAKTLILLSGGLGGAVVFFLVTNFAVWSLGGGFSRPRTPAGLVQCFADALPFFRPTVWSMLLFLPATAVASELLGRAGRLADLDRPAFDAP